MLLSEYNTELHIKNEKAQSYLEGEKRGKVTNLIELICKKLQKGKSPATIADELETDLETVTKICTIIDTYKLLDDPDAFYERLHGGE